MKRIRVLEHPTPGLVDYLHCDGEQANWEGFRSHQAGAAYREIIHTLCSIQHGLCGYCEVKLTENNRQVEHVVPQSDSHQCVKRALDPTNMVACCKGGTWRGDAQWLKPPKRNLSCGQSKGNKADPGFVDPRSLPRLPSLMRVRFDGRIVADAAACTEATIDVSRVNRTIDILGLNVERLRLAREKIWRALNDSWREHLENHQLIREAARLELVPGADDCLPQFFTKSRSYFGVVAE